MKFALAGRIVGSSAQARKILRCAVVMNQRWLIPQARSVAKQLKEAGK